MLIAITGVTAGLGYAMVHRFSELGHRVVGCGRNEKVIGELNSAFSTGSDHPPFSVVDVACEEEIKKWIACFVEGFGCPNFFLNNASIINEKVELWNVSSESFDKLIDINVKGTFYCIKHIVPIMIKHKQGIIVNFSSGWGRVTSPYVAPYCCSKFGIEGLSMALAKELPPPLAAVALSPGVVNTDMLKVGLGEQVANACHTPAEWAETACPYILSIDRSMNGRSLSTP